MNLFCSYRSSVLPILALCMFVISSLVGCDKSPSEATKETPKSEVKPPTEASHSEASEAVAEHKHDKPGETCFICDPTKRDKGRLWCKEHNRYEDRCWLCHPEQEDKKRLFCKEHSLYEDECFLCHPELLKKDSAPVNGASNSSEGGEVKTAGKVLMCKEHGMAEDECGICHPDLLGTKPPGKGLKVHLPSGTSAAKAGVVAEIPAAGQMQQGIECLAELEFNQNKVAQITPLVEGVIKSVEVDLGSRVKEGDLLARITSAAIGEAQGAYLKALAEERLHAKTLERKRSLYTQRITPEKDVQEAQAAHEAAAAAVQQSQQQLSVLGFDKAQIQALAELKGTSGILEIRAPFDGVIVERAAVRGAMVGTGKPLFTVADTLLLWAMVTIPESQLARVKTGQQVKLKVESLPGEIFTGTLTWLSSKVDERTRMASGRVELSNAEGHLKAQMFAKAFIVTSNSENSLIVPQTSLQEISGMPLVFVKFSEDIFEARPVKLGAKHDGKIEILAGLQAKDPVVVAGSFALKSQFLISRLGAGCCAADSK